MTSPYLMQEANRPRLVARNPAPAPQPPKVIVSSHAEYRTSDYRFARQQTNPLPLEKTRPIESTAARLLRYAMIGFIFASAWAATGGIAWLLTRG